MASQPSDLSRTTGQPKPSATKFAQPRDAKFAFKPFQYDPALQPNQIRLLKLKSGISGAAVEFSLHTETRGENEYYALSYAWGNPIRNQSSLCNGQSLMITSSLLLALSNLRKDHADRYLWVDAICINQNDPEDKSIQVRRMSSIYRDAVAVIVWLGEDNETTGMGLELLSNLCRVFPSSNGDGIRNLYLDASVLPDPWEQRYELEKQGIPIDPGEAEWKAAGLVLEATWFGRRWIL